MKRIQPLNFLLHPFVPACVAKEEIPIIFNFLRIAFLNSFPELLPPYRAQFSQFGCQPVNIICNPLHGHSHVQQFGMRSILGAHK